MPVRLLLVSPVLMVVFHVVILVVDPAAGPPGDSSDPHGYTIIFTTLLAFLAMPILIGLATWGTHRNTSHVSAGRVALLICAAAGILHGLWIATAPAGMYDDPVTTTVAVLSVAWAFALGWCGYTLLRR